MDEVLTKKAFFKDKINEKMDFRQYEMVLASLSTEQILIPIGDNGYPMMFTESKIVPVVTKKNERYNALKKQKEWVEGYLESCFEDLIATGRPIVVDPLTDHEIELTDGWLTGLEIKLCMYS